MSSDNTTHRGIYFKLVKCEKTSELHRKENLSFIFNLLKVGIIHSISLQR